MVQDIAPGSGGSNPRDYTASATNVFFVATTPELGTELWVGTLSGALPISRIDLKGVLNKNDINLEWNSFNEQNVKGFEVQRSTNGTTYDSIGEVKAKGGDNISMSYYFTDYKVQQHLSPVLYYRLKIRDNDGAFTYSKTISVGLTFEKSVVTIWPNPVKTQLEILFTLKVDENIILKLYDQQGRLMQQEKFKIEKGTQKKSISLSTVASGIYTLSVRGNEINCQFKLIKQ